MQVLNHTRQQSITLRSAQGGAPTQNNNGANEARSDYEKRFEAYYQESRERDKTEGLRTAAVSAIGIAAGATAGYFLGNLTGVGGHVVGAVLGAAGGVTVGGLIGSWIGSDKGSSGLAYLGMGALGGLVAGLVAGGVAGGSAWPIVGSVAGGGGGLAVGYYAAAMLEDAADKSLRAKHGLD